MDSKIRNMKPGQSVEISRTTAGYCTVERSGDGRTLRFVRHIGQTSTVFHTEAY